MERPKKIFTCQIKTIWNNLYGKRKRTNGKKNYGKLFFCKVKNKKKLKKT